MTCFTTIIKMVLKVVTKMTYNENSRPHCGHYVRTIFEPRTKKTILRKPIPTIPVKHVWRNKVCLLPIVINQMRAQNYNIQFKKLWFCFKAKHDWGQFWIICSVTCSNTNPKFPVVSILLHYFLLFLLSKGLEIKLLEYNYTGISTLGTCWVYWIR